MQYQCPEGTGPALCLGGETQMKEKKRQSRIGKQLKVGTMGAALFAVLLLANGCISIAAPRAVYEPDWQARPSLTVSEAQRRIQEKLQGVYNPRAAQYQNVQANMDGFSFFNPGGVPAFGADSVPPQTRSFEFKRIAGASVYYWGNWSCQMVSFSSGSDGYPDNCILWGGSQEDAIAFADAINAMKYYSSGRLLADDAAAFAGFQQKAWAWRALSQKPALPEEVQRFKVLAEDAFQNKEFEKAVDYYAQGLAIEPLWPAGQLNAALFYGELHLYGQAVMHMKRYLELCPDATDAKKCRNQMWIWQEKINEGETHSQSPGQQPNKRQSGLFLK
jgi:tetratricopeptide (TPR) repeat protein